MFKEIEEEFKTIESHRRNGCFAILFFVIYFFVCMLMWGAILKNIILILIPVFIFLLLIYIYVVINNLINKVYVKEKWFYIFRIIYSIDIFNNQQRKNDKLKLIELLINNGVNTRPKVGKILEHYRMLMPRNINGRATVISVLAFFISILSFVYDSNLDVFVDKMSSIFILIVLVLFSYFILNLYSKKIAYFFGEKILYIRMEDLLTEIYIKSDIK